MYCLYMFCRGILVIEPKRAVGVCGAQYIFYHCSGRADTVHRTSGGRGPVVRSNGNFYTELHNLQRLFLVQLPKYPCKTYINNT